MKKYVMLFLIIVLLMNAAACKNEWILKTSGLKEATQTNQGVATEKQVEDVEYNKDGIAAKYPKLISGGKEKELNKWNRIISSDFDQILHIYSFNPVPEPTPVPSAVIPVILDIRYDIKDNNDKLISILYLAAFHNPYSAHPTDLVYTTNINKINSSRSRLGDTVKINEDFVKDFRTWDIVTKNENEEVNKAINDYIAGISDEDLLKGFQSADQIGSKNPWSIYSYYTPDKLGISIGVPNYIGDHVELEREYTKLKDFIKPETKILP